MLERGQGSYLIYLPPLIIHSFDTIRYNSIQFDTTQDTDILIEYDI